MKKAIIKFCSLVGLLIGLTVAAQAQRANHYEAAIPFDFNVGNKTFTAGEYAFGLTNPTAYQPSLTIRNLKSGAVQVVLVTRNQADGPAAGWRLLFNRYDDRYFLSAISTSTLSAEFLRAKAESRLAGAKNRRRETVALKR